jgi:AcrR family transcriptional regulator
MSDVKTSPAGRPTLRQERAATTRRRILTAARRLFFRDGYAATTLKAVAAEAGVAVQTVYAVFGSKAAILAALREQVVDQPEADRALQVAIGEPTFEQRLAGFARSIRLRWELAGDIVQDAAGRRQAGITRFMQSAAEALAHDLDVPRAIAIADALSMYDLYDRLVGFHRWPPDDYQEWLTIELQRSLTPTSTT